MRAADALEQQLAATVERQEEAEGAPWRLQYQFGDTYELVNESATPKFHVWITGESIPAAVKIPRIDGRSSTSFMALSADGLSTLITVKWQQRQDDSDAPLTWAGTKPARR